MLKMMCGNVTREDDTGGKILSHNLDLGGRVFQLNGKEEKTSTYKICFWS